MKSFTAEPSAILDYGPLQASDGRVLRLTALRPAPGGQPDLFVARVEGITDRTAAEGLNRIGFGVPRDRLGEAEEDEFLLADLIGLSVLDRSGKPLGRIVGVPNYGAGDLLDIAPLNGGASALLPFTRAFVPEVDIAARTVVADLPDDFFTPPRAQPRDRPEAEGGDSA